MNYRYSIGVEPAQGDVVVPRGRVVGGQALGILVINAWYPMLPGNVANASTYDFPVVYKILKEASVAQILSGDPALLDLVIAGGKELVDQGVGAVVGACGSLANYQREAANALEVPTYLSVMLQAPLILQGLRADQRLGVIVASRAAMTPKVFEQCGIQDPSRLVFTEAVSLPEFQRLGQCQGRFDPAKLEQELVGLAREFVTEHGDIGAVLLQCSDLPPFAWSIQKAVGRPVFDMNSLVEWVYRALIRRPYQGFI
ncbi:MAG: aspartate/glutamate racemase family protein [Deltaproteobacteria bacterium]|nr:aspartate/glutamate racemase family protein [Deltaproteobacteria bacterium]